MEGSPLFPEAPQDDDDSESSLSKKRDKKFESKDGDDKKPKRISLENLFVREEVRDDKQADGGIQEIFSRKSEKSKDEEIDVEAIEKLQTEEPSEESIQTQAAQEAAAEETETLSDDEVRCAVEAVVQERTETLQNELQDAEPGSQQEAEALAGASFVENLLDKAHGKEVVDEAVMDAALHEAAADIGAETVELDAQTAHETDEVSPDADEEVSSDTSDWMSAGARGGVGGTPPPVSASGGSGRPPVPPATPIPPATSPPPPPPPPGGAGTFAGLPGAVAPAGAVAAPSMGFETPQEHSHTKYVLAGGIVGYLMGRRRGRIKTERQLLPVQQKLEKEVGTLTQRIEEREQKIRSLARRQYENHVFNPVLVAQKLNAKHEQRSLLSTEQGESQFERSLPRSMPAAYEAERSTARPEGQKRAETMQLAELLQVARGIELNGTSVSSMFETGRLDTPALRRIVKEYMQNGDYKKELLNSLKPERLADEAAMEREAGQERSGLQGEIDKSVQQIQHETGNANAALYAKDDTPQMSYANQMSPEEDAAATQQDMRRKLMMGVGSVIGVIILALIVGMLLRAVL